MSPSSRPLCASSSHFSCCSASPRWRIAPPKSPNWTPALICRLGFAVTVSSNPETLVACSFFPPISGGRPVIGSPVSAIMADAVERFRASGLEVIGRIVVDRRLLGQGAAALASLGPLPVEHGVDGLRVKRQLHSSSPRCSGRDAQSQSVMVVVNSSGRSGSDSHVSVAARTKPIAPADHSSGSFAVDGEAFGQECGDRIEEAPGLFRGETIHRGVAEPVDVRRFSGEVDEGADHRRQRLIPGGGFVHPHRSGRRVIERPDDETHRPFPHRGLEARPVREVSVEHGFRGPRMFRDLVHRQFVAVLVDDETDRSQQFATALIAVLLPPRRATVCDRFHVTDGIRYCR